ncbi:hypothetical protein VTH82DRAFT_388 [Thermothelomyces myriococcoides]
MHFGITSVFAFAGLAAKVTAHGLVTKPATRSPGKATAAACGKTMVDFYLADNTSYPEALLRANPDGLGSDYDPEKCNLWLCKGYQFADNIANVQNYTAGQVVDMEVWIRIPHEGYANVSIVDTASNSVIGEPLVAWPEGYAGSFNPPEDQTKFSFELPDVGEQCAEAGACVIQWYWFGQGQTYESCVDFTLATPSKRRRYRKY